VGNCTETDPYKSNQKGIRFLCWQGTQLLERRKFRPHPTESHRVSLPPMALLPRPQKRACGAPYLTSVDDLRASNLVSTHIGAERISNWKCCGRKLLRMGTHERLAPLHVLHCSISSSKCLNDTKDFCADTPVGHRENHEEQDGQVSANLARIAL